MKFKRMFFSPLLILLTFFALTAKPALAAPIASLDTNSLSFGNVDEGSTSAPMIVTLTNTGTGNLTGIAPALTTGTEFDFVNNCAGSLGAGLSCTIDVTFSPTTTGMLMDTLTVVTNNGGSPTVDLDGTGVAAPVVDLSTTMLDFGMQPANLTSSAMTVTVENTGGADLMIGTLTLSGADASKYAIGTQDCGGATLSNGQTCTIDVTFTPDAVATFNDAFLNIPSNAASSVDQVDLDGEGIAAPVVGLSPTSVDFGAVLNGTTSDAMTVTVTNVGLATLDIGTLSITGADAAKFSIDMEDCDGVALTPTNSCTIDITFSPDAVAAFSATLEIPSNADSSVDMVPLSGNGSPPVPIVSVTPSPLNFGDQGDGTTSLPSIVTINNIGFADLNIGSLAISGADSSNFAIGADNCSNATVTMGNSCTVGVTFSPDAVRAFAASLDIPSNASSSPDAVVLMGTGVSTATPVVSLSPTSLEFGDVVSGNTLALTLSIGNSGSPALNLGSLSITENGSLIQADGKNGALGVIFAITNDNCSNVSLSSGAECTVDVTFSPLTTGDFAGTLSIPSNAPTSPDTVALSGTGITAPISDGGGCSLGSLGAMANPGLSYGLLVVFLAFFGVLRQRRR